MKTKYFDLDDECDIVEDPFANEEIVITEQYLKIKKLIDERESIIFVTGGAGTGKSTMIRWLMRSYRNVLLAAPTAIAAINVGGKTIHSLCMFPPSWILDADIKQVHGRKWKEVHYAQMLIIDEVSMVNPNILDAIDKFMQLNRRRPEPFGGLVTVLVGDLFQLPPVVTDSTRTLFNQYDTPYFYSANCIKHNNVGMVELPKTFRQKDPVFIDVLSDIRRGINLAESLPILNSRCEITDSPGVGVVRLSPRNLEVVSHNNRELGKIDKPAKTYVGELTGNFKETAVASPVKLTLKIGAQVMFTQNEATKLWVNGTVGTVLELSDLIIWVQLPNGEEVEVTKARWPMYDYVVVDGTIGRKETGSYTQFPLTLAWALTIHKSQGKTIEKVHVDLGAGSFETGQTYVALSRCPTMEGLTLSRPVSHLDVDVDKRITKFYEQIG